MPIPIRSPGRARSVAVEADPQPAAIGPQRNLRVLQHRHTFFAKPRRRRIDVDVHQERRAKILDEGDRRPISAVGFRQATRSMPRP